MIHPQLNRVLCSNFSLLTSQIFYEAGENGFFSIKSRAKVMEPGEILFRKWRLLLIAAQCCTCTVHAAEEERYCRKLTAKALSIVDH